MVTAIAGCFVECDIPTREYLIALNDKQTHANRFIVRQLDNTHLLVKADKEAFVRQAVKEFNDKNVYTPPPKDEQRG